tara:strand:+ start:9346 stop:11031 length:1686 start_codon:yes stop_codon:yes gene_type:complete
LALRLNLSREDKGRLSTDKEVPDPVLAESARLGRRGFLSPLTCRILVVNVLALAILFAGLLYLGRYEQNLIDSEIQALTTQGEIFAEALAEGAYGTRADGSTELEGAIASTMLRRWVTPTKNRIRLFDQDGTLVADSRTSLGLRGGSIIVSELPPPDTPDNFGGIFDRIYQKIIGWLPARQLPLYEEQADQRAADYGEVSRALEGEPASAVRLDDSGRLIISAAVPLQRFKQVIGAVFVARDGQMINEAVRSVRFDILTIFGAALFVTVLLSIYLGSTIVRPLRRLAAAADKIRIAPGQVRSIPEFAGRNDEIGDLAADLNAMTDALSHRFDAIESFAADVAHELKNPLTSLRSAVETASRLKDIDQQQRLMDVIQDDVQRLDRLISDISDASRLDAELSRDESEKLDLSKILAALVEVHSTAGSHGERQVIFEQTTKGPFVVLGNEGRIVQVLQNLISNAFSFSPPTGRVMVQISRDRDWIIAFVEDEGPGIPPSSLEKIFDRFYSERPENEQFGTHSGLGLSISRQIVAAHGGIIEAENRTDTSGQVLGARFIVKLPNP